jgi:polysaccharide export outer membrane protein
MPMERLVSSSPRTSTWSRETCSVLGATDQNVQITFNARQITLVEALAKAGSLQDLRSDPAGVFLFRFESPAVV